jgi:hypothetical protein
MEMGGVLFKPKKTERLVGFKQLKDYVEVITAVGIAQIRYFKKILVLLSTEDRLTIRID